MTFSTPIPQAVFRAFIKSSLARPENCLKSLQSCCYVFMSHPNLNSTTHNISWVYTLHLIFLCSLVDSQLTFLRKDMGKLSLNNNIFFLPKNKGIIQNVEKKKKIQTLQCKWWYTRIYMAICSYINGYILIHPDMFQVFRITSEKNWLYLILSDFSIFIYDFCLGDNILHF